ncbi:MAG: hypothetical protein KDE66_03495 [Nitrosomonas sp.]|nr:hypothetical protein [Nitrosomonas sp.]
MRFISLLLTFVLSISGCLPSKNPLYSDDVGVFLPRLIGAYKDKDGNIIIINESSDLVQGYEKINISQEKREKTFFRLVKLGEWIFIDSSVEYGTKKDLMPNHRHTILRANIYDGGFDTFGLYNPKKEKKARLIEYTKILGVYDNSSEKVIPPTVLETKELQKATKEYGDVFNNSWNSFKRHSYCISGNCNNGKGEFVCENGGRFFGEFKDGSAQTDDQSPLILLNGDKYVGSWKNCIPEGNGKLSFSIGTVAIGEFKNGSLNGQGTMEWKNGAKYIGDYKNGVREGYGTYIWSDGSKYVGTWKNGNMHGLGIKTLADGTQLTGEWEKDRLLTAAEVDLKRREEAAKAAKDAVYEAARIQVEAENRRAKEKHQEEERRHQELLSIERERQLFDCKARVNTCKSQCESLSNQIDEVKERWYGGNTKTSPRGRCKSACEQPC